MKVIRFILIIGFVFQSIHAQAPKQYNVKGTAYYKSNILIEEAEVILMDTTEKVISRTKTSKKLLKRFGGGKFTFSNIKPGHYKIRIITEEEVNINHRFEVKNKSINVGRLYPFKEFPKYVQTDYPSTNLFKMRRFSTEPTPGDSINIRHIIVDLNGIA
ncbi:MAG: carboxypeptidase regulatory-like domain-containing protein, partial [Candidatus Marinimicrobia bacterium]|nr:carboxypeptidase regulatory-like domain-containing protein [Candidatus Neomarinimicrobiota bacterium]